MQRALAAVCAVALRMPLLLWGGLLLLAGSVSYVLGVVMSVPRALLAGDGLLLSINEAIVWYSGVPTLAGLSLAALDLFVLLPYKRRHPAAPVEPVRGRGLDVVLTALNDELSIAEAVADFAARPEVRSVTVVDNASTDATAERAAKAGARVVIEPQRGYGRCVWRSLQEALAGDGDLILLCEGDCTFRAADIEKFLAYIDHADIVNGTRIVEQLRAYESQLTTFMYFGNFFVGKLLEMKHIGRGTFTDVGTTYKLCRRSAVESLLPRLDASINLEFNAHLLDTALCAGLRVVECPITFHPRVGVSKGGNVSNRRALRVGMRMMAGLIFGWGALGSGSR